MENTLSKWLESQGLSKYLEVLLEYDIESIALVKTLSADDLKALGVLLGDRKRFVWPWKNWLHNPLNLLILENHS
jgi:hypothetical protein